MRRLSALLAVLPLLSAGCAVETTGGSADEEPPAGSNSDDRVPESGEDDTSSTKKDSKPQTPTFGQAFTWENGVTVKVSKPVRFQPSPYAAKGKGKNHLRFSITVVNKSGKPYEVACDYISLQSGNAEAEQIFDTDKGLKGSPSTATLDGREAKYAIGFTVKNPADLVMEYAPCDFELKSAIFATSA